MVNCIVIDDDQDTLDVFSEVLDFLGFDVIAKGNHGKNAEKLFKKYHPDVIFIDLMMPKYDGFYAIEKIRHEDPNAKIIIITGDLKAGESHLLNSYSVTAIIYKPFDIDTVKKVLANTFLD